MIVFVLVFRADRQQLGRDFGTQSACDKRRRGVSASLDTRRPYDTLKIDDRALTLIYVPVLRICAGFDATNTTALYLSRRPPVR